MTRVLIMDTAAIDRALTRMAHEIVERNADQKPPALVGIRTHGVPLAQRLAGKLQKILKSEVETGELDISFYRDDYALRGAMPKVGVSEIPFDVTGRTIVLVDDVLFTGRSTRAAMEAVMQMGRPQRIQLAALVDRGHRELPVRADFVGKNVPTARHERVCVRLREADGQDEVFLEKS